MDKDQQMRRDLPGCGKIIYLFRGKPRKRICIAHAENGDHLDRYGKQYLGDRPETICLATSDCTNWAEPSDNWCAFHLEENENAVSE